MFPRNAYISHNAYIFHNTDLLWYKFYAIFWQLWATVSFNRDFTMLQRNEDAEFPRRTSEKWVPMRQHKDGTRNMRLNNRVGH